MGELILRDYQSAAIDSLRREFLAGKRNVILHSPTGAGKTITAASLIKSAQNKGKKVLFLANRRELIFQARDTLAGCGVVAGVIMAGEEPTFSSAVQVASMQTYVRRMNLEELGSNPWFHAAAVIVVDECHGAISPSYQKILKKYGGKTITVGLTATPCRGDGRGLGEYFDALVSTAGIGELIDQGYLVQVRYFVPSTPDLDKIRTVAGDYDRKELGERMDKAHLVGDIVENWLKICPERATIVFAVNVRHSIHIVDQFLSVGITAEHVDAKTPAEERADILKRLRNGKTQIVSNVGILCEGFDFPAAGCIILARPTKSLGLYLQMAGRGLRPYPGKRDCILIDHGGTVDEHGLVEWAREWSLDGKEKAWSEPKKKDALEKVVQCRACDLVFSGGSACPDCGTEVKLFGKKINVVEADLVESTGRTEKGTVAEKRIFLGMLKHYIPRQKNPNPKRIIGSFRGRYGIWPHHSYADVAPIEPDQAFLAYMQHQAIKWAKGRKHV